jgi:hypothetical protein
VVRSIKKESEPPAAKDEKGSGKKSRKENKHEKREKYNKDRPALIQTLGSIFADGGCIDAFRFKLFSVKYLLCLWYVSSLSLIGTIRWSVFVVVSQGLNKALCFSLLLLSFY